MSGLSPDQLAIARAIDVVTAVSERRLRGAGNGVTVCVPARLMRELAEQIERAYPGAIAETRRQQEAS